MVVINKMNLEDLAQQLSEIEYLETWASSFPSSYTGTKKAIFKLAEPLWVQRMIKINKLFVHPNIIKQLKKQSYSATDIQKRMIWASVLASAEGSDSKQRFNTIKKLLREKYGYEWWEDVYRRKNNAWAAKERIRKKTSSNGSALKSLINNTSLFANAAREEVEQALKMIPEI